MTVRPFAAPLKLYSRRLVVKLQLPSMDSMALAKIADTLPAIIFVDIMMPRLDGYQTCALIKNNAVFHFYSSRRIIALSSK